MGRLDVRSKLGYVKRLDLYKTVKPYCLNIPVFPNGKMQNIEYEYVDNILIEDIRFSETKFTLDVHGFELANHETSLKYSEFEDVNTIYSRYFPESEEFLKNMLGAARVFAFEHQIRRRKAELIDNPVRAYDQPLTGVHCDQTLESMNKRIRLHLGEDSERLIKGRHQVINIWRPLKGPVQDYPLAVCEYSSIDAENDLQKADLIFPHYE